MTKNPFDWADPLLLELEFSDEEKMIRESARQFAQDRLMPVITEANRHETFDRSIIQQQSINQTIYQTIN
jgi:glutaryl-CoA dehydrogenase